MSISDNIRFMRKHKGFTQKELAKLSGIAEITIRKYENDDRQPKIEQIEKIAKALDVAPAQIMGADYWDAKHPELSVAVSKYELFIKYLKSIGYSISEQSEPCKIPKEKIPPEFQDEASADGFLTGETFSVTLSKDSTTAEFTQEEFEALQNRSKESLDGMILLQYQKNKKEPPSAATENGSVVENQ